MLGGIAGVLAGVSSFVFLEGLERVTVLPLDHDWLLYLLPAAGLLIGFTYHYLGGRSAGGNSLLIDQIHEPTEWVPRRMAPLVLVGTWITHMFGGSAGREGTALQMSGSVCDALARTLRLSDEDRKVMLMSALGGGFGAVFGVPFAGAVFALEVQSIGRVRYEALVPALAASLVGDMVVNGLGYEHHLRLQVDVPLDSVLYLKIAVAGLVFGLAGAALTELTHAIKRAMARTVAWPPLRPLIGGIGVIALASLFGRDYLGSSLPLIDQALAGEPMGFAVFALKIVFTAVTVGCAFPGGEVTPLFVVGATLGAALAYVFSNHRGIYPSQRIGAAKGPTASTAGLIRFQETGIDNSEQPPQGEPHCRWSIDVSPSSWGRCGGVDDVIDLGTVDRICGIGVYHGCRHHNVHVRVHRATG